MVRSYASLIFHSVRRWTSKINVDEVVYVIIILFNQEKL